MRASNEYRRLAGECMRIAETMSDPRGRATLMHMAGVWLELAQQAESGKREKQAL